MFTRILVALDGSELAERVLMYLEPLAEQLHSQVILLCASTPPEVASVGGAMPVAHPASDLAPLRHAEQAAATSYVEAIAQRLRGRGLAVRTEHPEGPPAEVIVTEARRLGAELIAMTSHGRGGLGRLVFGSVADAVLQHAPCPVLLVRVEEEAANDSR